MSNPFEDSPPFAEDTVITKDTPIPNDSKEVKRMKDNQLSEAPASVNGRIEGLQWTLRAVSFEQLAKDLKEAQESGFFDVVRSLGKATAPTPAPVAAAPATTAIVNQSRNTPTTTDTCVHGTLVYDEWGTNKFGKPYRAFKCPVTKEDWKSGCGRDATVWYKGK